MQNLAATCEDYKIRGTEYDVSEGISSQFLVSAEPIRMALCRNLISTTNMIAENVL